MNFELIDNLFQVAALGCAAAAAVILALRHKSRPLLMLALAYACFAMGTLYFVLHLAIIWDIPRVFYVSEVSWLASYLSFLSLQILRTEALRIHMRPLSAAGAALTAALALVPPGTLISQMIVAPSSTSRTSVNSGMRSSVFKSRNCRSWTYV